MKSIFLFFILIISFKGNLFSQSITDSLTNIIGYIDTTSGYVFNHDSVQIGLFKTDSTIIDYNNHRVGKILNNEFYDENNKVIASISGSSVLDVRGHTIGTVLSNSISVPDGGGRVYYYNLPVNWVVGFYFFYFNRESY